MKKEATTEIIKHLNDTLDAVCKYLAEDNYNEANKLQEEYYKIEDEYNLFDYTYEENGKMGVKDITGKIRVPAIYCNYSELYSYTIKREEPIAAQNEEGKFALVTTDGEGAPLCSFKYDMIECKHYTRFYTCCKMLDGKIFFGLLTAKGQELVPCEMDVIYGISNGIIVFEKDGKSGFVTCWGLYVPPIYNELTGDEHDLIHAELNGQWGHISDKGTFIPDEDKDTFDNTCCLSFGFGD